MKATQEKLYDVFVSHTNADWDVARKVSSRLKQDGLSVPVVRARIVALAWEDVRRIISETPAFVIVVSSKSIRSPNLAIEVGAAMAWSKAIFVVRHGLAPDALPTYLAAYKSFGTEDLEALARAVRRGLSPLTVKEIQVLRNLYVHAGIPSDRLASDPSALDALTTRFNRMAHANVSAERLRQEIIRQRKSGKWPRLRRSRTHD